MSDHLQPAGADSPGPEPARGAVDSRAHAGPDYYGRPTRCIETAHLAIDVLAAAGPRIVRVVLKNVSSPASAPDANENQLAEEPAVGWDTPWGRYDLLGGHRLWHSPEAFPRSYIPDDKGLEIEELPGGGLRLTGVPEEPTGMQKVMEIVPAADAPRVTIRHALKNVGLWPVEAAPWAITQFPHGGVAVFPMTAPGPSPYAPNRYLQLWGYTRWDDPRMKLHDLCVMLEARRLDTPDAASATEASDIGAALKIGYLNHAGWAGYLRGDLLFVKRFAVGSAGERFPDNGCNVESYLDNRFIEIETLGRFGTIEPGEEVLHTEEWEWYPGITAEPTLEGVREMIRQLNLPGAK